MSQNYSDYQSPFNFSIAEHIPENYQNPLNTNIATALFDRFLTRPETQYVIGSVGRPNPNATTSNQIIEADTYDQAFQLQPVVQAELGSETLYYTYKDLLGICERNGIDTTNVQSWQTTQGFNFALPIDLDKYTNYQNYFWTGTGLADYVVIRSPWITLQQQVAQQVTNYASLLAAGDTSRASLWPTIEEGLNTIFTYVPTANQFPISSVDVVTADTIHAAYVPTTVTNTAYETTLSGWQTSNFWVHQSHVVDISTATRAQMPILEYSDQLQMTAWTITTQQWNYRSSPAWPFATTSASPTNAEIFNRFPMIAAGVGVDTFTIAGDQSALFTAGMQFTIEESSIYDGYWTATAVEVVDGDTVVNVATNVITGPINGNLVPFTKTSQGDPWVSFFDQWQFVQNNSPLPSTPPANQITPVSDTFTATAGQTEFELQNITYVIGSDTIDVYVNDVQQYGTYNEDTPTSVQFLIGLNAGDQVKVVLAACTANDLARMSVPVCIPSSGSTRVIANECLVQYRMEQQAKTDRNQYPVFDLVNYDGTPQNQASRLISFTEESTQPIDPIFGKRIIKNTSNLTVDYTMTIDIVENDTLIGYVYNGVTNTVWMPLDEPVMPILVDENGNPTTNTTTGVYEIPEQFTNNPSHELRPSMLYSELFAHFNSIIASQQTVNSTEYGILTASAGFHLLNNVDFGVGGSIREHNGSFDTFVSTLISSEHQYTDVIGFARDQYREMLVDYYGMIQLAILQALQSGDPNSIADLGAYVSSNAISSIETNSLLYRNYGDSTIGMTYGGIDNFIATIPYFGYIPAVKPELLIDSKLGILELIHHDGHSVLDDLESSSFTDTVQYIAYQMNLSAGSIITTINPNLTVGEVIYDVDAQAIYRLNVVGVTKQPPLLAPYPEGSYWASLTDLNLYQIQNGAWVSIGTDLTPAWQQLDFQSIITTALFDLEQDLYNTAQAVPQVTNPIQQITQAANLAARQSLFEAFCQREDISQPYVGNFVASNPFTWYYASIPLDLVRTPSGNAELQWGAYTYNINEMNFGTKYPHLQPWCLQGYTSQPTWWNGEYQGTTRRWSTLMWQNILAGKIPEGYALPNGTVSNGTTGQVKAYNFVSVNTINQTTVDGYGPDDLLPPYWVPVSSVDNISGIADQVFLNCDYSLLVGIATNWYPFGTVGPNEQLWMDSVDYTYDLLIGEYYLRPVDFVDETWGEEYAVVNSLNIDKRTQRVYSHLDAVFHGDTDSNGDLILINGVNQWYTQYYRYINLDTNATNYKNVWSSWVTHLCYNVQSYLIDNTLAVGSTQIDISPNDYSVASKVNSRVSDQWIDALYFNISQVGSMATMPNGNGSDWKFNVFINCPISRPVSYFAVKKATISANPNTNVFTMNGSISGFGWTTGTPVVFDVGINGDLPAAIDNLIYYFLIPLTDTTFQIASTPANAGNGVAMSLESDEQGTCYVSQLNSTFYALNQANASGVWRHNTISTEVLTFTDSITIVGVQNLIDLIDGYQAYLLSEGYLFNQSSAIEYDATTGRQLSWQFEIERVINTMYMYARNIYGNIQNAVGTLDINPFRNHLWVQTPQGVLTPFNASDVSQSLYRAIVYNSQAQMVSTKDYHVLRQDQLTQLSVVNPVAFVDQIATNDYATILYLPNSIGGAHIFFDQYEHIIVFSDYAISGDLIYDSFLGIQVPRVTVTFEKQLGTPKRPNIGGYVLNDDGTLQQNWEYTVSNITDYYDTFTVNENSDFVNYGRALLGYQANQTYMTDIGATPKSQFLFYKGLIQNKGTIGSINAFTNASVLNTAVVDEFWAYKSAEFGEMRIKQSYLMNLETTDTVRSHMKLQYTVGNEAVEQFFTPITNSDSSRWLEYPNQRVAITDNSNVSFELKVDGIIEGLTYLAPVGFLTSTYVTHPMADAVEIVLNSTNRATLTNNLTDIVTLPFNYPMGCNALIVYLNGQPVTNFTELAPNRINVPGAMDQVVIVGLQRATLIEGTHYTRVNNRIVQFIIAPTTLGSLDLIHYSVDPERCVPISILDNDSNTTVVDMVTWDPLTGVFTNQIGLTVDLMTNVDPAVYNTVADPTRVNTTTYWNQPEVGDVWLDTWSYHFVPYNDNIAQDTSDKLVNWGRMEDWSEPTVYSWVGTDLPPASWTDGTPYQEVYTRSRPTSAIVVAGGVMTTPGVTLTDGQEIVFDGSTSPLTDATLYTVQTNGAGWSVVDQYGNVQTLPDGYTCTLLPAEYTANFTTVQREQCIIECATVGTATNIATTITPNTEYVMYLDGHFLQDGYTNSDGSIDLDPTQNASQLIGENPFATQLTIMVKTGVLDGLSSTQPDDYDLTNSTVQEFVGTPYVQVVQYDDQANTAGYYYYYWVTGSADITLGSGGYLGSQLENWVSTPTGPFLTFSGPVYRDGVLALSKLAAVGISGLVSEDDRYILRLVQDDTLRDRTYVDSNGVLLKPLYTEWALFREQQDEAIDQRLWNLVIESMVGYKLSDPTTPIPALDRVVYDKLNGTNTRYGMDVGQAFCNGAQAQQTIYAMLNDPTISWTPNDIDLFLETHDMNSNADIITFMNDFYSTFEPAQVNAVFFAIMMDALTIVGANFATGLIKTSGIAVTASMPLNVNGVLDG